MAKPRIKKFVIRVQVELPKLETEGEMWVIHEMDVSTLFGQLQYEGVTADRTDINKNGNTFHYKTFKLKDIPKGAKVYHWDDIKHIFDKRAAQ